MSEPASSAELIQQGLFHHRRGELAQAVERYSDVLRSDPGNADALYYVAMIACQEEQFRQGIELAGKALAGGPPQARIHNLIGKAHERLREYREALAAFDAAIAVDANFAEAHGNRAALLAAAGRRDEALKSFDRALALDPKATADWVNRGILLQELDRHTDALASYQKALAISPNDIHTLMNRANALTALHRYAEAEADYDRVIKRQPRLALAHAQKGVTLRERDRHADALTSFDRALAIDSNNPVALKNKGLSLYALGRLEEACSVVERVISLTPNDVELYALLSRVKRFAAGNPAIAAMEALLRDPQVQSPERQIDQIHLFFALAKAYEDIGEREKAFQHLMQGNAVKRRQIGYDEINIIGGMEHIRATFTPELMQKKTGSGEISNKPVFVLGMPRSGTTLVEQILASHPAVFGAGEQKAFREAIGSLVQPGQSGYPTMVPAMTADQLQALGAAYLSKMQAVVPDERRFTDKLPGNFARVGLIHLALPNARIIHVQRNPLDTCLSIFSMHFNDLVKYAYDLGEIGRYYRAYRQLMDHWRRVLPEGVMLDVQYEDVVDDIEGQARRMLAYCDLPWDDTCLAFHENKRPVLTASASQVRQPLYRSSLGRWKAYADHLGPLFEALDLPREPAAG